MKSHNICYVKTICSSIYTCFILYPYLFNFHTPYCDNIAYFILGKVYVYAFHLKQGGVIQLHSLNILYGYKMQ